MKQYYFFILAFVFAIHCIHAQEEEKDVLSEAGELVCNCITELPEETTEEEITSCFQSGALLLQLSVINTQIDQLGEKKKKKNKEEYTISLGGRNPEIEFYLVDNCERYQELYPSTKYYRLLEKAAPVACNCISEIPTDLSLSVKNKSIQDCMIGSYRETDALPETYPSTVEDVRLFYKTLEEILVNYCEALSTVTFSDDQIKENSYSTNEKAIEAYNKGQQAWEEGNIKKAIKHYQKAVKIDKQFVFAWDNLGRAYREINKLDKAIEAYKQSLAIDPDNRVPLMNIGIAYSYQKDWDNALKYYNLLQEYHPDDAEAPYGKALIYYNMGNLEASLENAIAAYKLYTSNNSPYKNDAKKVIHALFDAFKSADKEEGFHKICEVNQYDLNMN